MKYLGNKVVAQSVAFSLKSRRCRACLTIIHEADSKDPKATKKEKKKRLFSGADVKLELGSETRL